MFCEIYRSNQNHRRAIAFVPVDDLANALPKVGGYHGQNSKPKEVLALGKKRHGVTHLILIAGRGLVGFTFPF